MFDALAEGIGSHIIAATLHKSVSTIEHHLYPRRRARMAAKAQRKRDERRAERAGAGHQIDECRAI